MFEIFCEECNSKLIYDHTATVESCLNGLDYNKNTIIKIQDKWLSEKLLYTCLSCNKKYAYSLKELEEKIRETVAKDVMLFKRTQMLKSGLINPKLVNPDSGLAFCGVCPGLDMKGNCYVAVINQCTIKSAYES